MAGSTMILKDIYVNATPNRMKLLTMCINTNYIKHGK